MRSKTIILALAIISLMPYGTYAQPMVGIIRGDEDKNVVIHQTGGQLYQGVTPLDEPDVYFDSDEMVLSLYGWDSTLASYYVEVVDYYGVTVASETVAGYGWQTVYLDPDTASGTATVTITTSRGDEYSGTFYVP